MKLVILLLVAHLAFGGFEAGAARRSITPNPLLPRSGGMQTTVPAKSKVSELTVQAMVFRAAEGSEMLAIASPDLFGFPWCPAVAYALRCVALRRIIS